MLPIVLICSAVLSVSECNESSADDVLRLLVEQPTPVRCFQAGMVHAAQFGRVDDEHFVRILCKTARFDPKTTG